jgi:hypothetical protein
MSAYARNNRSSFLDALLKIPSISGPKMSKDPNVAPKNVEAVKKKLDEAG